MKFTMSVEIDDNSKDAARELRRILRYWSNQITAEDVDRGASVNVYDGKHQKVGRWSMDEGQADRA